MTTESFEINASEWRIEWEAAGPTGIFQVEVHEADFIGLRLATPVEQTEEGSGASYVHHGEGRFYLVVRSSGFEWTVRVLVPEATDWRPPS